VDGLRKFLFGADRAHRAHATSATSAKCPPPAAKGSHPAIRPAAGAPREPQQRRADTWRVVRRRGRDLLYEVRRVEPPGLLAVVPILRPDPVLWAI